MRLNLQKNILVYDSEKDRYVFIKDHIHYSGEKRFKVVLGYGYGASEVNEIVYVKEDEVDSFIKRFSKKKEVVRVIQILKECIVENKNNLTEMREHLFNAIRKVADGSMSIDKAKSISTTAEVINNSIKVEIEYKKMIKDPTSSKIIE